MGLDALRKAKRDKIKAEQKDLKKTFDDDFLQYSNMMLEVRTESDWAAHTISSTLLKSITHVFEWCHFFGVGGVSGWTSDPPTGLFVGA